MPKSKDGDGRRGNRPPDAHKILPGQVLSPNGRRGKLNSKPICEIDQFMAAEARKIVIRGLQGDVTAGERLVQEEFFAALAEKNPQARARLLKKLSSLQAGSEKQVREELEFGFTCKAKYEELFEIAERRRVAPPDVGHPSHVQYRDGEFVFTGPADAAARKQWEDLKCWIKICAHAHGKARRDWHRTPTEENLAELKRLEAHRRKLMRLVPNGWDWREEIYCRYSRREFVEETIRLMDRDDESAS